MILVTGITSFVGEHLLPHLVDTFGCGSIILTARDLTVIKPDISKQFSFYKLRLENQEDFSQLPTDIDTIVNIAASSSTEKSIEKLLNVNIGGLQNLIHFARRSKVKKFIFLSSLSVYGDISEALVSPETPIVNPSPYGLSKRLGELLLDAEKENFASVCLRLPAVLGRGAKNHWLAQTLDRANKNAPLKIYNPKALFNNAVDVDDLCQFICHLCNKEWEGCESFPLASQREIPIRNIVKLIIKRLGSNSLIEVNSSEINSFIIDNSAAFKFGFRPIDISSAIIKFTESYNEHT